MKILVINGSPKGERSDTLKLTRTFLDGMGETAEIVDTMSANINSCLGCYGCWYQTPGKCVQRDDMTDIFQRFMSADMVIWSLPLYFYGVPGKCKLLMDRLLPVTSPVQVTDESGHTYHPSQYNRYPNIMLISGCGYPDREGNFDGLIFQFQRTFGQDIPMILCVEAPLLSVAEAAPVAQPYLELVHRAGTEFKQNGRISDDTQARLDAPMYSPDEYRKSAGQ